MSASRAIAAFLAMLVACAPLALAGCGRVATAQPSDASTMSSVDGSRPDVRTRDAGDITITTDAGSLATDGGASLDAALSTDAQALEDDAALDGVGCANAGSALDGGCGDPETDPHNCGACGHDCMGGACEGSMCVPLPAGVLATGQYAPTAIAVDSSNVYWINGGIPIGGHGCCKQVPTWVGAQVLQCAITGCGNRPTVLAGLPNGPGIPALLVPSALTLDATNLYWTEPTAVRTCSKGGCACMPSTLASGQEVFGVAVSSTSLYFTLRDNGEVATCPIGGCSTTPMSLATSEVGPSGITLDGSDVYWTTNSTIMQCALGGCNETPTSLWHGQAGSTQANTVGIAVDATNLYWTNAQPDNFGSVLQCGKANCGGTLVTLARARTEPLGIAADGQNVYWGDSVGVVSCAVGGCGNAPTVLAAGAGPAVALDATRVYFTQPGATPTDGRIMMISK